MLRRIRRFTLPLCLGFVLLCLPSESLAENARKLIPQLLGTWTGTLNYLGVREGCPVTQDDMAPLETTVVVTKRKVPPIFRNSPTHKALNLIDQDGLAYNSTTVSGGDGFAREIVEFFFSCS